MSKRQTRLKLATAIASALGGVSAVHAQVSGTWVNPTAGTWTVGSNWSSSPLFPDGGGTATFAGLAGTVSLIGTPLTLGGIVFNASSDLNLNGATITLVGPAEIFVGPAQLGETWPSSFRGPAIHGVIAGSAGLTKTGPGVLRLASFDPTTYTGGTRVMGGILEVLTWSLGTGSVTLDGGTLRGNPSISSGTISTSIVLGAGGGTLMHTQPSGFNQGTYSGVISGAGTLNTVNGRVVLTADNTFTGPTRVVGGFTSALLELTGNGAIRSSSHVTVTGSLRLNNSGISSVLDRIGNTTPVTLDGGVMQLEGELTTETVGTMTLKRGANEVAMSVLGGDATSLAAPAILRQSRATLGLTNVQDPTASPNKSGSFTISAPLPMTGGNGPTGSTTMSIVPWIYGRRGAFTHDSVVGLRPLRVAEYAASFPAGSLSATNVRLTSAPGSLTVNTTINSLTIDSGFSSITLGGSGVLTVTSGALVNASGFNTVAMPVNFGAAEGVVSVAEGWLRFTQPIAGTNGVTFSDRPLDPDLDPTTILIESANTYTGTTTINSGLVVINSGNVTPGVPGPFGSDSSAIVLHDGAGIRASASVIARPLLIDPHPDATTGFFRSAPYLWGGTFTGGVILNGPLQVSSVSINGNITGPGRFVARQFGSGSVMLGGVSSFTGGVQFVGPLFVGTDKALGTGPIIAGGFSNGTWTGNLGNGTWNAGTMALGSGSYTINNPIVLGSMIITKNNGGGTVTLGGPISLNGSAGTISSFGERIHITGPIGHGRLALDRGDFRLAGPRAAGFDTLLTNGASLTIESSNTLGDEARNFLSVGTNSLLRIGGGIVQPMWQIEAFRNSFGPSIQNLSGNNVLDSDVTVRSGTISVDAGSLRITGSLTGSGTVTTAGVGTLEVGNIRGGTLAVMGGVVRVTPNGTDAGLSRVTELVSGPLDLSDNDLIINLGSEAITLNRIREGFHNGVWNGLGLRSSLSDTTQFGLGYSQASFVPGGTSFGGQFVNATSILVKYTHYGDANLDGDVDVNDLARLAEGWQATSEVFWRRGDFDYDGVIGPKDLALLALNWQAGVISGDPLAPSFAEALAAIGLSDPVPEPVGTGTLLTLACAPILHRRRRLAASH